jgi:hypothetical protein
VVTGNDEVRRAFDGAFKDAVVGFIRAKIAWRLRLNPLGDLPESCAGSKYQGAWHQKFFRKNTGQLTFERARGKRHKGLGFGKLKYLRRFAAKLVCGDQNIGVKHHAPTSHLLLSLQSNTLNQSWSGFSSGNGIFATKFVDDAHDIFFAVDANLICNCLHVLTGQG